MKFIKLDCVFAGAFGAFVALNMNCETVYNSFFMAIDRCENEESVCYVTKGTPKGLQCFFKGLENENRK